MTNHSRCNVYSLLKPTSPNDHP